MMIRNRGQFSKLVATLFAILLLAACSQKPQEKILGKWQEMSKAQGVFEFFSDGTLTMGSRGKTGQMETMAGRWVILSDGRLKFDVVMLGTPVPFVMKLRFDGADMVFVTEGGVESRFKKIT